MSYEHREWWSDPDHPVRNPEPRIFKGETMQVFCSHCSKIEQLKGDVSDGALRDRRGWTWTSRNGWRCPDHPVDRA